MRPSPRPYGTPRPRPMPPRPRQETQPSRSAKPPEDFVFLELPPDSDAVSVHNRESLPRIRDTFPKDIPAPTTIEAGPPSLESARLTETWSWPDSAARAYVKAIEFYSDIAPVELVPELGVPMLIGHYGLLRCGLAEGQTAVVDATKAAIGHLVPLVMDAEVAREDLRSRAELLSSPLLIDDLGDDGLTKELRAQNFAKLQDFAELHDPTALFDI